MPKKDYVDRTVQYWRLVDGRTGLNVPEIEWHAVVTKHIYGQRRKFVIDTRDHSGTSISLAIQPSWADAYATNNIADAPNLPDPETTYGVIIAAGKDYVPNQEHTENGEQAPMSLRGEEWEPVDNLFVTFLPFGNLIAVLSESASSSKAAKFADWLNRATVGEWADPEFTWAVKPVIDPTRASLLESATGLKSAIFAGEFGQNVNDASGLRQIFMPNPGSGPTVKQIRLEVKASVVRGGSGESDQSAILDWFTSTFGDLEGKVDKAQVTLSGTDSLGVTEVDLIHHRLTRKSAVRLVTGTSRAFTGMSAVSAIIDAYVADFDDLLRLRNSDV